MAVLKPYKVKSEVWMIPDKKGTKLTEKIFFVCDGYACSKFDCGECHLTSNPDHAKKFELKDDDISGTILESDQEE